MSDTLVDTGAARPMLRDYWELCKPNVVALMILTSVIGMLLAVPGAVPLQVLLLGNLGIALCAGSAAAVNHLVDRHVDLKMARTYNRPIAKGRVAPANALLFALILGGAGTGQQHQGADTRPHQTATGSMAVAQRAALIGYTPIS